MKHIFLTILILKIITFTVNAQSILDFNKNNENNPFSNSSSFSYIYKDYFNHSYKSYENLLKDTDKDGYINFYDRHDKNPDTGFFSNPYQSGSSYYGNYKSSYYDYSSGKTIYEGSRGGKYYINENGNKTYLKK